MADFENKEKQFKPITQLLEKVEKAVIQTDKDLTTKLEPKQLTFGSFEPNSLAITSGKEEDEENDEKILQPF